MGRPDLTAKLHLIELPPYLLLLWLLIRVDGIDGAAIIWTARVAADAVALFGMARWLLPQSSRGIKRMVMAAFAALGILFSTTASAGLLNKTIFLCTLLAAFAVCAWFMMLTPGERASVQNRLGLERVS
jgi:hypothetical protein